MAFKNRGAQAVRERRSTLPWSRSSRVDLKPMKASNVGGLENSTKKSQSLSGVTWLVLPEPNSQARFTPKRDHSFPRGGRARTSEGCAGEFILMKIYQCSSPAKISVDYDDGFVLRSDSAIIFHLLASPFKLR